MKPTELLKKEHKAIKLMLKILNALCNAIDKGKDIDNKDLSQVIDFIKVFADKRHHKKEEDLLFPAMETAGIPKKRGPIGVMLEEHNLGRSYVRYMSKAISAKALNRSKFTENAYNYIALLKQHIDKEDNILYKMANICLSDKQQDKLLKEFKKIEMERNGFGKNEKFHKLLHRLKSKYL